MSASANAVGHALGDAAGAAHDLGAVEPCSSASSSSRSRALLQPASREHAGVLGRHDQHRVERRAASFGCAVVRRHAANVRVERLGGRATAGRRRRAGPRPANSVTVDLLGAVAALDVQRLPRRVLLVLGEAERELARVAERGAVDLARAGRRRRCGSTSCSARPIVALARLPWPSTLTPLFMPIARRDRPVDDDTGPLKQVVASRPCMLNSSVQAASTAASTTGRYSGRQPAITALIATFSTVHSTRSGGTSGDDLVGRRGWCRRASAAPARRSGARPAGRRSSRGRRQRLELVLLGAELDPAGRRGDRRRSARAGARRRRGRRSASRSRGGARAGPRRARRRRSAPPTRGRSQP